MDSGSGRTAAPRGAPSDVIEKLLAGFALVLCAGLLLRLLIGQRRRYRLDAWCRDAFFGLRRRARSAWHWRSARKEAERVAEEAIRRARAGEVEREGNVYKPKSFRKPPRDKMH